MTNGDLGETQETRTLLAHNNRKSLRIPDTIIAALIGGAIAVVGMLLQNQQARKSEETARAEINSERENALAKIELARIQAETRLSFDIRSHILSFSEGPFSSKGTYEGQISAMMRAFELDRTAGAISVHSSFRNGATIRALEQIRDNNITKDEKDSIDKILSAIPKVLFLDSRLPSNIYCQELVGTGRTNIDAFAPEVRDLPIRIAARSFLPGPNEDDEIKEIEEFVSSSQPDLIVAHLSVFESNSGENRINILEKIVKSASIRSSSYFPSIILYSRLPRGKTKGKVNFPAREEILSVDDLGQSFFATIAMVGHDDDDSDCFLGASENSIRLRQQLVLAVAHQSLYSRDFSE